MSSNLEKGIIGAAIIASSASGVEAQEKNVKNIDSSKKTEINVEQNKQGGQKAIYFEDAEKILNQGGNYNEGINNPTIKQEVKKEISEENRILLSHLNDLEKKFSKLSEDNYKIIDGSVSVISSVNLSNKMDNTKYGYNNGIKISSSLENRALTDVLDFHVVNTKGIKVLGKDPLTFSSIKEAQLLNNEGYIDLPENGNYKHYIPEYYIILDQENKDRSIVFNIKVVSSKQKNVIKNISITETLPEGDQVFDPQFKDLVDQKIIPDLTRKIDELLNELKLIKNG